MSRCEQEAERENRWDDRTAVQDARLVLGERVDDLQMQRVDPGEIIESGPCVEALGVNYAVEGCECDRGAGVDVAELLGYRANDVWKVFAGARDAASQAEARYELADGAWRAETITGVVPVKVSMLKALAKQARSRANRLCDEFTVAKHRAEALRVSASLGEVSKCGPEGMRRYGCGQMAVVFAQEAWQDVKRCLWCEVSHVVRKVSD
jgi:hypothetical protein